MWKKTMLAIGLAGALTVPAGMALAATDDPAEGVDRNRVTTLAREQARDQVRDQVRDQAMIRDRLRIHDPATCDGTGPMGGNHDQAGSGLGTPGAGYGQGAMDGSGPIHTPPADGTGHRFGAAER